MQMQHPNVLTDAWAELTFFDQSPLSVLELTALAGANRHFYQKQWPRYSILYDFDSRRLTLEILDSKLIRLGERVLRAASEEDRCRAAWALAVLINSLDSDFDSHEERPGAFLGVSLGGPSTLGDVDGLCQCSFGR